MPAMPLPHRISCPFFPLMHLSGRDDRLAQFAADLFHQILFEHLVRHPVVSMTDTDDQNQANWGVDDGSAPEADAEREKLIDWQFEVSRRDELLLFQFNLDPAAQPELAMRVLTRQRQLDAFTGATGTLSQQLSQVLGLWLRSRGLPPAPRPLPSFNTAEYIDTVRAIEAIADAVEKDDPGRVIQVASQIRAVPVAALRLVLGNMHGPFELELEQRILQLEPDNPIALRQDFFRKLEAEGESLDRNIILAAINAAPQWGKPHLSMHGKKVGGKLALRHQGIAAQLMPSNPWAQDNFGLQLMNHSRPDEALRSFDRAVKASPLFQKSWQNCMDAARATDRLGEAFIEITERRWRFYPIWRDSGHDVTPEMLETIAYAQCRVAETYKDVGRLDEAIDLYRAAMADIDGNQRVTDTFNEWTTDPAILATCFAREGHHRKDPGRVVLGYGKGAVENGNDVAHLIDALIALGREELAPIAFAACQGKDLVHSAAARLAGARAHVLTSRLDLAFQELEIVRLHHAPGNWELEIDRLLRLAAARPSSEWETLVRSKLDAGAKRLARLAARDGVDFVPGFGDTAAAKLALANEPALAETPYQDAWVEPLRVALGREVTAPIDGFFHGRIEPSLETADLLVNDWPQLLGAMQAEDPATGAKALYLFTQSLCRYLAATTGTGSALAGGLRTLADESLSLLRKTSLAEDWFRPMLECVELTGQNVDYWLLDAWLLRIERALQIENTFSGHTANLTRGLRRVAQLLRGDERIAFEHRQAEDLRADPQQVHWARSLFERCQRAIGTGSPGIAWSEVADTCLPAAAALDVHWTAAAANPGNAIPWINAAKRLFELGRRELAFEALVKAFPPTGRDWRNARLAELKPLWDRSGLGNDVPIEWEGAQQKGMQHFQRHELDKALKCLRWCDAIDSGNKGLLNNLAIVYARLGRAAEAVRTASEIDAEHGITMAGQTLLQAQKTAEGLLCHRTASMSFKSPEQWLGLGAAAWFQEDDETAALAYEQAFEMKQGRFSANELNSFATSLYNAGMFQRAGQIAELLVQAAGNDPTFHSCGMPAMARALLGQGRAAEAVPYAERAAAVNPLPDNVKEFAETLARAKRNDPYPQKPLRANERKHQAWHFLDLSDPLGALNVAEQALAVNRIEWPLWRAKLAASEARFDWDNETPAKAGLKVAWEALTATAGLTDLEASLVRTLALRAREEALYPVDPVVPLGQQIPRDQLEPRLAQRRARAVPAMPDVTAPKFDMEKEMRAAQAAHAGVAAGLGGDADPIVFPGQRIAKLSDYVSLMKAMRGGDPMGALARYGLDMSSYAPIAMQWSQKMQEDPTLTAKFGQMMQA